MRCNKATLLLIFSIAFILISPMLELRIVYNNFTNVETSGRVNISDEEFPNLTAKNMTLLGLDDLWTMGYDGTGINVAVLDTGVDGTHAELIGKVIYNNSFVVYGDTDYQDHEGHGTVVAGIIGSKGVGSGDYMGVAPGSSILNIKVLNQSGEGFLEWVASGIEDAVANGAHIISLSLGADPIAKSFIEPYVSDAWENGVAVVIAAGNEGPSFETTLTPGDVIEPITVGSGTIDLFMLSFSSAGPTNERLCKPEVVAPGAFLIGPAAADGVYPETFMDGGNKYAPLSGTSVSTPVIAGMVAVLMEATSASVNAIKIALMQSATDLGYTQYRQGYGIPNATEAYNLLIDSNWEPALFLPSSLPQFPFEIEDVYNYPITVITGKQYDGAYFTSDLPINLPSITSINGHYILNIGPDLTSDNKNSTGYIRLMSSSNEILAEMTLEIFVIEAENIVALAIAAALIIALVSIAGFLVFHMRVRRLAELKCPCIGQPGCDCEI